MLFLRSLHPTNQPVPERSKDTRSGVVSKPENCAWCVESFSFFLHFRSDSPIPPLSFFLPPSCSVICFMYFTGAAAARRFSWKCCFLVARQCKKYAISSKSACVCLFAFPAHRVELGLLKGVRGEAWGVGPDAAGKTENSAKPEKCVFGEPMRLRFGVVSTAKRRTLGVPSTSCPPSPPDSSMFCCTAQYLPLESGPGLGTNDFERTFALCTYTRAPLSSAGSSAFRQLSRKW